MINAQVVNVENSIRVIPNDGYSIKITDEDGFYYYVDGFVQFPLTLYDESKIDIVLTETIPVF